jgi:hypothetical protein
VISYRWGTRAFPIVITVFATVGCYAEPYCAVTGSVSGNFSGQIAWKGTGEEQCVFGILDELEMGTSEEEKIVLDADGPLNRVALYSDVRVTFQTGGRTWSADGCQVNIASVVREDWTKSDYLYITGTVGCPTLTSEEAASIQLDAVGFSGYFIEDGWF